MMTSGERAFTRWRRVLGVPVVPFGTFWIIPGRGELPLALDLTALPRVYGLWLVIAAGVLVAVGEGGVLAASLVALGVGARAIAFAWGRARARRIARAAPYARAIYGSACPAERLVGERRAALRAALVARWDVIAPARTLEDTVAEGARDEDEAMVAHLLLVLAGAYAAAARIRVRAPDEGAPSSGDGPFRSDGARRDVDLLPLAVDLRPERAASDWFAEPTVILGLLGYGIGLCMFAAYAPGLAPSSCAVVVATLVLGPIDLVWRFLNDR